MTDRIDRSTCPFAFPLAVRALGPDAGAEPARTGEHGPCPACDSPDSAYVWTDDRWRLRLREPTPFPGTVVLETRQHHDSFRDLGREHLAELGGLLADVERAVLAVGGIGRVHVSRWGDGSAHFHLWFYARPARRPELRGTFAAIWELLLPAAEPAVVRAAGQAIGDRLRQRPASTRMPPR